MTEPLAYRDLDKLQILCLVQTAGVLADADTSQSLCESVAKAAEADSPIPVETIAIGDPQVVQPRRLTVLVHAAIDDTGGERRLALTMRPYRPAAAGSDVLFGAMPRIVAWDDEGARERTIAAALDEILPWRGTPGQVRPLK